ncbi:hypothetical protein AAZX31_12G135600 [Glycine max]|nr:hypothetical protein GLYMA_12G146150v4 [Glycine max]KAH1143205.1 hypothetical protein GYH30_033751 [Glycine max]
MDKLPTNEKLQGEDCNIVSMCSLCEMAYKKNLVPYEVLFTWIIRSDRVDVSMLESSVGVTQLKGVTFIKMGITDYFPKYTQKHIKRKAKKKPKEKP